MPTNQPTSVQPPVGKIGEIETRRQNLINDKRSNSVRGNNLEIENLFSFWTQTSASQECLQHTKRKNCQQKALFR